MHGDTIRTFLLDNIGDMGVGIIAQQIGRHSEVFLIKVLKHHIVTKLGLFGVGAIFSIFLSEPTGYGWMKK